MKEQLVSFEVAKLAKERNFGWKVREAYFEGFRNEDEGKIVIYPEYIPTNNYTHCYWGIDWNNQHEDSLSDYHHYSAPTQSLLARWLREKHGIYIILLPGGNDDWGYQIILKGANHTQSNRFELDETQGTYEQALEAGLQEGLKLIK